MNAYIQKIREQFEALNVSTFHIRSILVNPSFAIYPASCAAENRRPVHHGEIGGLARHTYEVLKYALAAARPLPGIRLQALMVGAVWHDFGKIAEYQQQHEPTLFTRRTPQLSHICHGLMMWREHTSDLYLSDPMLFDAVAHIITSHHGRKEWGSPVEPMTIEALLVHQADMVSVMMECGTNPTSR